MLLWRLLLVLLRLRSAGGLFARATLSAAPATTLVAARLRVRSVDGACLLLTLELCAGRSDLLLAIASASLLFTPLLRLRRTPRTAVLRLRLFRLGLTLVALLRLAATAVLPEPLLPFLNLLLHEAAH